jgi:hypothetical protein
MPVSRKKKHDFSKLTPQCNNSFKINVISRAKTTIVKVNVKLTEYQSMIKNHSKKKPKENAL